MNLLGFHASMVLPFVCVYSQSAYLSSVKKMNNAKQGQESHEKKNISRNVISTNADRVEFQRGI